MDHRALDIFSSSKPVIGCIHLLPLPGSPRYDGNMSQIIDRALQEALIYEKHGISGLIVENFGDSPFYPDRIPAETTAAMTVIGWELVRACHLPIGINALRNDAMSAMAIATAIQAPFIRVNIHMGAALTDQGIIQGMSYRTLRYRTSLKSTVLIFADVAVKHAAPLADRSLELETLDLTERGMVDAIIVSGDRTGSPAKIDDLRAVCEHTHLPVFIGSGTTPDNVSMLGELADGFIVGSTFKQDGSAEKDVDESRVRHFMSRIQLPKES